ncbi:MAG: ABC transporter substrate-binding protein, partial [Thermoanaerobacterium sp.]|nr:ABC transporter substrate-binding protein [Thermoanaerobacterium sp.]
WHLWTGYEAEALQKVVDEFNQTHEDIQVKLVSTDFQKQLTALASGSGPDIAGNFNFNVASWASKGAMLDLTDLIKQDNYDIEDFVPAALEMVTYKDRIYAFPLAMHVYMVYYNKDILKEAGYDNVPEKLSEFKTMIEKVTIKKNGNFERLGYDPSDLLNVAAIFGAKYISDDGKEILEDPAIIKAMKFNKEYADKFGYEDIRKYTSTFGKYMSPDNPFFTGQLVVKFDGEWLTVFIDKFAPNLNYGIAPLPYPDDQPELKNSGYASSSVIYISGSTKHPKEAWTFLKWLVSKEPMVKFTSEIGNLPTRKSAMSDPAYDHIKGFKEFLEYAQGENVHPIPSMKPANEYVTELGNLYEQVLTNKISPEEAMKRLKEKLDPEM